MGFCRESLNTRGVSPAATLVTRPHGCAVSVAGVVLLRQRPGTAKGVTFVTLEDETGTANLVVWQSTRERYRAVARASRAWLARGTLERKDTVVHVLVRPLDDLSAALGGVRPASRNFH